MSRNMSFQQSPDFHQLANELYHQGKFQLALENINKTLENMQRPESFYLRGVIYETLGDNENAYKDYKKAMELDKTDVCYWENLAKISKELEKYAESIEYYTGLMKFHIESQENSSIALCNYEIGSIYDILGNYEQAKKHYEKAIEFDTKEAFNYKLNNVDLIHTYEFKAKLNKSLMENSFFSDVNSSKIQFEDDPQEKATVSRSESNQKNDDKADLIKKYESELALKPMDTEVNTKLGNLLRDAGRFEEAIKCYERSLEKQKKNKIVILKVSDCYYKIKDYEKAIFYCDKFICLDKKLSKAYKIKSICHFELCNLELALENINTAIELQPDNYTSKQYKKEIETKIKHNKLDECLDDEFGFGREALVINEENSPSKSSITNLNNTDTESKSQTIPDEVVENKSKLIEHQFADIKENPIKEELPKIENTNLPNYSKEDKQILKAGIKEDFPKLENQINIGKEEFHKLDKCQIPKFEENQINEKENKIESKEDNSHKESYNFKKKIPIFETTDKAESQATIDTQVRDPEIQLNDASKFEEPIMKNSEQVKEIIQKDNQAESENDEVFIESEIYENKVLIVEAANKTEVQSKKNTQTKDSDINTHESPKNEEPIISVIKEEQIQEKDFHVYSQKDESYLESESLQTKNLNIESTNKKQIQSEKNIPENVCENQINDSPIIREPLISNSEEEKHSSVKDEKEEIFNINKEEEIFEDKNNSEIYDSIIQLTCSKENNLSRIDLTESICLNDEKNTKSVEDQRVSKSIEGFSEFKKQEISFDKKEEDKKDNSEKPNNDNKIQDQDNIIENEAEIKKDDFKINEDKKSDEKELKNKIDHQIILNEEKEGNKTIKKNFSYNKFLFLFVSSGLFLSYYIFKNHSFIKNAFDKFGFKRRH